VDVGVTLTIEQGVRVEFGDYYMQVNGTLSARGTNSNPIYLVNCDIRFTKNCVSWNEASGQGSIIEYAVINGSQISINNSPKINNNTFLENTIVRLPDTDWRTHMFMYYEIGSADISVNSGSPVISNNNAPYSTFNLDDGSPSVTYNRLDMVTCTDDDYSQMTATFTGNTVLSSARIKGSPSISNNIFQDGLTCVGDGTFSISRNTIQGYYEDGVSFDTDYHNWNSPCYNAYITDNNIFYGRYGINSYTKGTTLIQRNHIYLVEDAGIVAYGAATIEQNIIYNCSTGIYCPDSSNIEQNAIFNCQTGIVAPNSNIRHNTVSYNSVGVDYYDLDHAYGGGEFAFNNLDHNDEAVSNTLSGDINAANNWWGTTDTAAIDGLIHDFNDDFSVGKVNYTPILTAPDPQAPTIPADLLAAVSTNAPTIEPSASAPPDWDNTTPQATPSPRGSDLSSTLWTAVVLVVVFAVIALLVCVVILRRVNLGFKRLILPPPPPP
jgi:hypothetical protein